MGRCAGWWLFFYVFFISVILSEEFIHLYLLISSLFSSFIISFSAMRLRDELILFPSLINACIMLSSYSFISFVCSITFITKGRVHRLPSL